MNVLVNELTRSATSKDSLADCTVEELRQMAGQYPYFSPLQFLYVKKLKEENSSAFETQLHKTFLYFQSPVWLNYLLGTQNGISIPGVGAEEPVTVPSTIEVAAEPVTVVDQTPKPESREEEVPADLKLADISEEKPIPHFKFQPIDPNKAAMTFEPYHTVDYFASQGIRFKEEEKPKDRFAQQLKSFTEWLKDMKRLPATEIAAQVNASDERKVEQMAEISVNDREVVTETMAEVWEKQGNHLKARETYEKLSLLNPAKSSYFAAKIEHLKNL